MINETDNDRMDRDTLFVRGAWLIATIEMFRSGDRRAGLEALFNVVRPHSPVTWRTGVRVYDIREG